MSDDLYYDYDVLEKWDSLSWNDITREVLRERMGRTAPAHALMPKRLRTLSRIIERVAPQPDRRSPANTLALVAHRIAGNASDGYRHAALPPMRECWERGLDAIDAEAQIRVEQDFANLDHKNADAVLVAVQSTDTCAPSWEDLPPGIFWSWRLMPDIVAAHWSHPSLWSEMGFGGPASPRGYVRLNTNMRDPWEANERHRE